MFDPEQKARSIARWHSPPRGLANENYEMLMMDIAQALREARAVGMEKAAQIAWNYANKTGIKIAEAIRAQNENTGGAIGQSGEESSDGMATKS